MRKPKEILKELLLEQSSVNGLNSPNIYDITIKAMEKYAEEYHQSELLKLNKSDVIKSVGDLNGKTIPVKFKVSKLKTKIYLDD